MPKWVTIVSPWSIAARSWSSEGLQCPAETLTPSPDKNPVVALREIAEETINLENLEEELIKGLQNHVDMDEPEEDEMDLLAIQRDMSYVGDSRVSGTDKAATKIGIGSTETTTDDMMSVVDGAPPQQE